MMGFSTNEKLIANYVIYLYKNGLIDKPINLTFETDFSKMAFIEEVFKKIKNEERINKIKTILDE